MEKEFGEGGKGVNIAGQDYALWFNSEGFRIAPGRSAFGPGSTLVPWVNAAAMVSNLPRDGMFATRDRIDSARDNELRELASTLLDLRRDFNERAENRGELPSIKEAFKVPGFPESRARIEELLRDSETRQNICAELLDFANTDRKRFPLLRFKHSPDPYDLYQRIKDMDRPIKQFQAVDGFAPVKGKFVTEEVLWNAVEDAEKTKDSRLAREFVAALPIELSRDEWIGLFTDFIQANFVADGMCADVCVHNTDGHNSHAHIMLTVRPLTKDGKWQNKTEKEYLCARDGEERGFTAAEFKAAQAEGWEKQYQYKVGRKKIYMPPSQAEMQGCNRISKYPKSTKYGRQNPISARWNSEEQLVLWRKAWAEVTNQFLERAGNQEHVDHRSHAERKLDEQPTIHEGVAARAMERRGIVSDRCELNRQIKADNALLRDLKELVKKLVQAVKNTIPAIAEAMEIVRQKMIIFRYQLLHIKSGKTRLNNTLQVVRPDIKRYENVVKQLKAKIGERRSLLEEKKATPAIQILRHRELAQKITALTKDIEELKSERVLLLNQFDCADNQGMTEVKQRVASMESTLGKLDQQEEIYTAELNTVLAQYDELQQQVADMDVMELDAARQAIRSDKEHEAVQQLRNTYGKRFESGIMVQSQRDIANPLGDVLEPASIRQNLQQLYKHQDRRHHIKKHDQER